MSDRRPATAVDGDHVVVRSPARGIHLGGGLGMRATGRLVDFRGMTWLTFKNGVVVEGGNSWNLDRLLAEVRRHPQRLGRMLSKGRL